MYVYSVAFVCVGYGYIEKGVVYSVSVCSEGQREGVLVLVCVVSEGEREGVLVLVCVVTSE